VPLAVADGVIWWVQNKHILLAQALFPVVVFGPLLYFLLLAQSRTLDRFQHETEELQARRVTGDDLKEP
jgi:hypothetical protein